MLYTRINGRPALALALYWPSDHPLIFSDNCPCPPLGKTKLRLGQLAEHPSNRLRLEIKLKLLPVL